MNTTEAIIEAIRAIPSGKVASYSRVAELAGIPRGARQVARILHSCSGKHDLAWWRILRADGSIALREGSGGEEQRELLLGEGIRFIDANRVDIARHGI